MKKLAIGVLAATILIAACGGSSSKTGDGSRPRRAGSTTTTAGGGNGGGSDDFSAAGREGEDHELKVTYTHRRRLGRSRSPRTARARLVLITGGSSSSPTARRPSPATAPRHRRSAPTSAEPARRAATAATALFTSAYAGSRGAELDGSRRRHVVGDDRRARRDLRDLQGIRTPACSAPRFAEAHRRSVADDVRRQGDGVLLKYAGPRATRPRTSSWRPSSASPARATSSRRRPRRRLPSIPNITLPGGITIPTHSGRQRLAPRLVADFPQAQSTRRGQLPRRVAIGGAQDRHHVAGSALAQADLHERADDRPHELPAERVAADLVAQHAVAFVDPARLRDAPRPWTSPRAPCGRTTRSRARPRTDPPRAAARGGRAVSGTHHVKRSRNGSGTGRLRIV